MGSSNKDKRFLRRKNNMNKRMWICMSLITGCLMIFLIFLLFASSEVMALNMPVNPTLNHDTDIPIALRNYPYQYHHGDWIVTGYEAIEDRAIILDGNLLIRPGGSLTLTNVTLLIEQGSKSLYQIYAEAGSSLVISNCTIAPAQTGERFAFIVQGAHFTLENSRLVGMMHPSLETMRGGLSLIDVNGAILDGNTISHYDSYGMWLIRSSNNNITNNTITCIGPDGTTGAIFLEYSHNNTITHNRLYRQWDALHIQQSWNNYIAYNELTLTDHTIGISIWFGSGNNVIAFNHISAHEGYKGRV
jgi:parallel beta-helix repeat protein